VHLSTLRLSPHASTDGSLEKKATAATAGWCGKMQWFDVGMLDDPQFPGKKSR